MSTRYTGIDLGSDSIKIVTLEKINNKYHVLAATSYKSSGLKKGFVYDGAKAVEALKQARILHENKLGISIKKVVACVPSADCNFNIVTGCVDIIDKTKVVGEDVSNVLKNAVKSNLDNKEEVVTAIPIYFKVDDKTNVNDPKGLFGEKLETKVVITTVPKEGLYQLLGIVDFCGLEVVDFAFGSTGDYYEFRSSELDKQVGAIVNIGEDITNVSIFNKGIMIKNSVLNIGSRHVNNDLAYVYKIDKTTAKKLKEEFAVASTKCADNFESAEIVTLAGEKSNVSQLEIAKVVEARIEEILKLTKKEIKNLTKRQIRYIIITGGLTEISGFQYVVEDIFNRDAITWNMTELGVRHNKYSSVVGLLKYFDKKLALRGKNYTMIEDEEIEDVVNTTSKEIKNENIVNKMFGHFFDN